MTLYDSLGRAVEVNTTPLRVISLVPSISSLICTLGSQDQLVGITKFCVHPPSALGEKTKIGGTKNIRLDAIIALKPDLIIANKEENTRGQVEELMSEFPVYVTQVKSLQDNEKLIKSVGQLLRCEDEAKDLNESIRDAFGSLQRLKLQPRKVAYMIWQKPWMTVGGDTFIHSVLESGGLDNIFGDKDRYPETNLDELHERKPDAILLSSEPYPFAERHQKEIVEKTNIPTILVDGVPFSWYGDQVLQAPIAILSLRAQLNKNAGCQGNQDKTKNVDKT